jgi:hypothetical protein
MNDSGILQPATFCDKEPKTAYGVWSKTSAGHLKWMIGRMVKKVSRTFGVDSWDDFECSSQETGMK